MMVSESGSQHEDAVLWSSMRAKKVPAISAIQLVKEEVQNGSEPSKSKLLTLGRWWWLWLLKPYLDRSGVMVVVMQHKNDRTW